MSYLEKDLRHALELAAEMLASSTDIPVVPTVVLTKKPRNRHQELVGRDVYILTAGGETGEGPSISQALNDLRFKLTLVTAKKLNRALENPLERAKKTSSASLKRRRTA